MAQSRAIRLGFSLLRVVGIDRREFLLQSESTLTLDQVEELLDMLDGRRDALLGIGAVAGLLIGDDDVDRTAALLLIQSEVNRILGERR